MNGLIHTDGPTKGAVILFIIAVVSALLFVAAGTAFAVYSNQHQVSSASQQWCDTLTLLTKTVVPKPVDPAANPSREFSYLLYQDFVQLKDRFGCS